MRSAAHKEQIKMVICHDFFDFIHHYEEHRQNITSFFLFDRRPLAEQEDSEFKLQVVVKKDHLPCWLLDQ